MRKPGHVQGVRRYQRYGQIALALPTTLAYKLSQLPDSERCQICGQPDNCGDCNHMPISVEQLTELLS